MTIENLCSGVMKETYRWSRNSCVNYKRDHRHMGLSRLDILDIFIVDQNTHEVCAHLS